MVAVASLLFADLGAVVTKVEPPDGDPSRDLGPFPQDLPDRERSGLFHLLNAGKRSVVADLDVTADHRGAADSTVVSDAYATGDADANDQIYQLDSSRDYNPAPNLAKITVPVLWINSSDDFINPPELGMAQQHVKLMPKAEFKLLPFSPDTKGHGTHTWAKFWKADLARLLASK